MNFLSGFPLGKQNNASAALCVSETDSGVRGTCVAGSSGVDADVLRTQMAVSTSYFLSFSGDGWFISATSNFAERGLHQESKLVETFLDTHKL